MACPITGSGSSCRRRRSRTSLKPCRGQQRRQRFAHRRQRQDRVFRSLGEEHTSRRPGLMRNPAACRRPGGCETAPHCARRSTARCWLRRSILMLSPNGDLSEPGMPADRQPPRVDDRSGGASRTGISVAHRTKPRESTLFVDTRRFRRGGRSSSTVNGPAADVARRVSTRHSAARSRRRRAERRRQWRCSR